MKSELCSLEDVAHSEVEQMPNFQGRVQTKHLLSAPRTVEIFHGLNNHETTSKDSN